MTQKTPLYDAHVAAGARMVDFGGWEMPINYGSQIEEHHHVRRDAGMFDVSHMTIVDLHGPDVRDYLSRLLANDVAKLGEAGKALYSCMLNERGGVIDDLITYRMDDNWYRVIVNAATRENDLAWMNQQADGFSLDINERGELAMVAVQGPKARDAVIRILASDDAERASALKPFSAAECGTIFIARTGYTGEDGFEVALPADEAEIFWNQLAEGGVKPCGLGARDTLRLEAGMNLYGQDMDTETTPLESGLAWTVAMAEERDFIGREALQAQREAGVPRKLVGLVLEDRGVIRHGQVVNTAAGDGVVTSGSFSPTLEQAIALARVPADAQGEVTVEVRNKALKARMVKPPFARNGAVCDGIN
ncbi:glycine cleavage system aminomethyltransferase GcvT [Marinihelvus fidelis]|uniref:Aminomethyltransferase n=1 Tax=Marinihelvus fidelis TaxID=2613842 RepID=A0A5N0T8M4_9GAMM|nr:glycine cleavage system aminomethyltransferase GcvT [Marinihelvus fidelis]KAA9130834.1 glycine cleavage system aminomethyltransferase GcvT [Marinihelvus fidelis]